MVEQKLENILWAEYERITRGQQVAGWSELPVREDQSGIAVKAADQIPGRTELKSTEQETSSASSVADRAGDLARDFGKSRLNAMPLISTLVGLFSRNSEAEAPPPLAKYAMPRSVRLSAANSRDGSSLRSVDYGQDGLARAYRETGPTTATMSQEAPPAWAGPGSTAMAPQILVNVQAMDSRSFLDHSQEIAQAVREAMLNMHALNDVVSEL